MGPAEVNWENKKDISHRTGDLKLFKRSRTEITANHSGRVARSAKKRADTVVRPYNNG